MHMLLEEEEREKQLVDGEMKNYSRSCLTQRELGWKHFFPLSLGCAQLTRMQSEMKTLIEFDMLVERKRHKSIDEKKEIDEWREAGETRRNWNVYVHMWNDFFMCSSAQWFISLEEREISGEERR